MFRVYTFPSLFNERYYFTTTPVFGDLITSQNLLKKKLPSWMRPPLARAPSGFRPLLTRYFLLVARRLRTFAVRRDLVLIFPFLLISSSFAWY